MDISTGVIAAVIIVIIVIAVYYYQRHYSGGKNTSYGFIRDTNSSTRSGPAHTYMHDLSDPNQPITTNPHQHVVFLLRDKHSDKMFKAKYKDGEGYASDMEVILSDGTEEDGPYLDSIWQRDGDYIIRSTASGAHPPYTYLYQNDNGDIVVPFDINNRGTPATWDKDSIKIGNYELVAVTSGMTVNIWGAEVDIGKLNYDNIVFSINK